MEARIDIITLAVADLERALGFYRDGLGLESRGVIGTEFVGDEVEPDGAIAMFELQGGVILMSVSAHRAGEGREGPARCAEDRRVQHRTSSGKQG